MLAMRATFTQQKQVYKLATRPILSAALENIHSKTLDIQKQLTEVICQVNLLADKSTHLPDALIGKQDLKKMQSTINECLTKLLAEQEHSRSIMRQLEIQFASTRIEVSAQCQCITDLEEALQTSKQKTLGTCLLELLALKDAIPATNACPQQPLLPD